jgi:hypothetical protein
VFIGEVRLGIRVPAHPDVQGFFALGVGDDESDGPMLLIPDHGDYFVCEAVADGYENVGDMVSGPWKTLEEVTAAVERYLATGDDADITDLYVVEVAKKVEFEKVVKVTLK